MTETRIEVRLDEPGFRLDVALEWHARVTVLFGPSGAGKTTLLETVLGLRPRAAARVKLAGHWLDDPERGLRVPVHRRRLGWVPQDPTLLPHLSVRGNLGLGLARAGSDGAPALARAIDVLEIGPLLDRNVRTLSGGERQRVALARAVASAPRALLLDEPLAALDIPLRARVLPYLMRIRDELGLPMLAITHDPDEAMLMAEHVVVLDAGRVVAAGPAKQVLWSRDVRPVAESLGVENVLAGTVCADETGESLVETTGGLRLRVPGPLEIGSRVRLGLRAEDVLLAIDRPGRVSARNVLPAIVARCEAAGGDALVHLDVGDVATPEPIVARVTGRSVEELGLTPGRAVHLLVKAWALRRLG